MGTDQWPTQARCWLEWDTPNSDSPQDFSFAILKWIGSVPTGSRAPDDYRGFRFFWSIYLAFNANVERSVRARILPPISVCAIITIGACKWAGWRLSSRSDWLIR